MFVQQQFAVLHTFLAKIIWMYQRAWGRFQFTTLLMPSTYCRQNCFIRSWLQMMFHSQKFSPNIYFPPILLHLAMCGFYWMWTFLLVFCRFLQTGMCNLVFHSDELIRPTWVLLPLEIEQLFCMFESCGCATAASQHADFWKILQTALFPVEPDLSCSEEKSYFIPGLSIFRPCPIFYKYAENNMW